MAGLQPGSLRNYYVTISYMINHIGVQIPLETVSFEMVQEYLYYILKRPISRATLSSYIRNARIFLTWIYNEHGLSFNPVKIKVPKSPKKNVHIYNETEISQIFVLFSASLPWITARNKAIVGLMLDSGLRQCEISNLRKIDVDRERMVIKITGKGAKDRMVPLGKFSCVLLDNYISLCPYPENDFIFIDRRGNALSGNAIRLFLYRLEKQLPFKLSSHKLRHNFATNYCVDHVKLTGKSDVYDLSILMGHESIETTKRYEHFAHEIIAAENSISHLDLVLKHVQKSDLKDPVSVVENTKKQMLS